MKAVKDVISHGTRLATSARARASAFAAGARFLPAGVRSAGWMKLIKASSSNLAEATGVQVFSDNIDALLSGEIEDWSDIRIDVGEILLQAAIQGGLEKTLTKLSAGTDRELPVVAGRDSLATVLRTDSLKSKGSSTLSTWLSRAPRLNVASAGAFATPIVGGVIADSIADSLENVSFVSARFIFEGDELRRVEGLVNGDHVVSIIESGVMHVPSSFNDLIESRAFISSPSGDSAPAEVVLLFNMQAEESLAAIVSEMSQDAHLGDRVNSDFDGAFHHVHVELAALSEFAESWSGRWTSSMTKSIDILSVISLGLYSQLSVFEKVGSVLRLLPLGNLDSTSQSAEWKDVAISNAEINSEPDVSIAIPVARRAIPRSFEGIAAVQNLRGKEIEVDYQAYVSGLEAYNDIIAQYGKPYVFAELDSAIELIAARSNKSIAEHLVRNGINEWLKVE